MAGTGLHPEGHKWKSYNPKWEEYGETGKPSVIKRFKLICDNCSQLAISEDDDNGECIDDY